MDSNTKRSSVVAGILSAKNREAIEDEPREAVKDARQAIPTPMLDVVLADGRILSFSYAYLTELEFTPGDEIKAVFGETTVVVAGHALRDMREKIRLHKADAIQEGTEAEGDVKPDGAAHVSRIEIETKEERRKERQRETGRNREHER